MPAERMSARAADIEKGNLKNIITARGSAKEQVFLKRSEGGV